MNQMMGWAEVSERWLTRFVDGGIKYDPRALESRRVVASGEDPAWFRAMLNRSRADRLQPKAA